MPNPLSVIITVNSPGEVSGWLKPFVAALKKSPWPSSITVFIPPCTFASGSECSVVRQMPEVDLVVEPRQVLSYLLFRKLPEGFHPAAHGIVLFLGGDLTYAALLAKRLNYPAIAYTEGFANWVKTFACFAEPYPRMKDQLVHQGVPESKLEVIGNLMLDAVKPNLDRNEVRKTLQIGERPLLLLMPGSRPAHFEFMVPFLLEAVELVTAELPEIAVVFSISPFISDFQVHQALSVSAAKLFGKSGQYYPGQLSSEGGTSLPIPGLIKTDSGLTIPALRGKQYDLMAASDLAISLPGTNTMELSFLGVPMIVAIPLTHPDRIPLEGSVGLIGEIPFLGRILKQKVLPGIIKRIKYTAWPNKLAQDYLVPELCGQIGAADVSKAVISLLIDKEQRRQISGRLKSLAGEPGAAMRLVGVIEEVIDNYLKGMA